jgi:maltose alpha-D-glucosyltransferase/alpha-amylase
LTFLRNHDELTLEMVTPEDRAYMWGAYAPDPRMRSNLGIRRRLLPLLDGDKRRWLLLNRLLLSLPGAPIVYYGDEIGMSDNIWLPDRHGCRTPMQWDATLNGGFSTSPATYFPVNADYAGVNVAAQAADPDSWLNWTRRLIAARQAQPALRRGALRWVETGRPATLVFWRSLGSERVLCVYNLSDREQPAPEIMAGFGRIDLLGQPFSGRALPPYAAIWLKEHS